MAVLGLRFCARAFSSCGKRGDHSSSRCTGLSLSWPLLLRSTVSRCAGSVIVAHGPSCPVACGILPDQGSNPCPPHWQADSQPLRHQGSPKRWNSNPTFEEPWNTSSKPWVSRSHSKSPGPFGSSAGRAEDCSWSPLCYRARAFTSLLVCSPVHSGPHTDSMRC